LESIAEESKTSATSILIKKWLLLPIRWNPLIRFLSHKIYQQLQDMRRKSSVEEASDEKTEHEHHTPLRPKVTAKNNAVAKATAAAVASSSDDDDSDDLLF
jgi:hypothetical protein